MNVNKNHWQTGHTQVDVPVPPHMHAIGGRDAIPIDEGLAPVLAELWARDIATSSCCQGPADEDGRGYILIFGPDVDQKVGHFLDLVAPDPDDDEDLRDASTLHARIMSGYVGGGWTDVYPPRWMEWKFLGRTTLYSRKGGPARWGFDMEVRFPPSDVPLIAEALTRAGAERLARAERLVAKPAKKAKASAKAAGLPR